MLSIPMTLDILLLLISGAAVLYCRQLSRRLKALHDLKSGVGEAIINLSDVIKGSSEASESIASQARAALVDLDVAVKNVALERQSAEDILETLDGQIHQARNRIGPPLAAAERVAEKLSTLTARSRVEMEALNKAVAITSKVSMLVSGSAAMPIREDAAGVHSLDEGEPTAHQASNPFREKIAQTG